MQKLLSHPDKLLIKHLSDSAQIALQTIQGKKFDFSLEYLSENVELNEIFQEIIYLSVAFHDLAKATPFFQSYIRNPDKTHDKRKNHALLSALFVYYLVSKCLQEKPLDEQLKQLLAVFAFVAVKRHHGKLDNLPNELFIGAEQEVLAEQVKSIDEKSINKILENLLKNYGLKIQWSDFVKFIIETKYADEFENFSFDFLEEQLQELPQQIRLSLFYFHQLLYATLLFSDKNDVILKNNFSTENQTDILEKINDFHREKGFNHPKSEINRLKNKAFFESLNQFEKVFKKEQHIYSVTLPTGLGKTITAFALAGKMQQIAGFDTGKIIISIPFTSIIDQNFEVYTDILKTRDSDVLLKHHHLAEPSYKTSEQIANDDESQFLIETWQSNIVVTTFVQLLEALFTTDKSKIMKLSQLSGSVVLLDEIQTVPYPLWETIREGFKILGEKYNIYFILISATQPLIFTPGEDIVELIPDYKQYFEFFNRTQLIIQANSIGFDDFKTEITDYALSHPDKDILVILNTKKSTRELFEYIRDEFDLNTNELYFMTTLITPYERKEIIRRIKATSDKRKIIVSTQLVEAGVDISVDTVFRQIAPLDSIIQAAGRANRYGKKMQPANVYIYDIDELKKTTRLIYGNDLIIKTQNVLKDYQKVEEKDYLILIEKYFKEVRKQSDNTSNPLLNAMTNFDFADVNLKLIPDIKTESVYIQLNQDAEKYWEQYVEIFTDQTLTAWEKKARFNKIKSDFYDFVINVPIPYNKEHIVFDSEKEFGFYVSKLENPSINYHYSPDDFTQNTGYVDIEIQTQIL